MRGSFLHNHVLIAAVAALLREYGIPTRLEFPVRKGRDTGFVDLFAVQEPLRLVCEAELSADRVWKDVAKAAALRANVLLIVVPNGQVARHVRSRLDHADTPAIPKGMEIWILPLGVALQRLRNRCLLMTRVNVPATTSHQDIKSPAQNGDEPGGPGQ